MSLYGLIMNIQMQRRQAYAYTHCLILRVELFSHSSPDKNKKIENGQQLIWMYGQNGNDNG